MQNQRGKREISRATTSLTRCPPCCRLWAVVRPRRAEVGYGYPPGLFGRVLGSFSVRRKRSRRKGRRRGRPRPGHFCPQCGQLRRSTSGVVEGDFRRAAEYRDDYYNEDSEKRNIAECIVAKNRHGETGKVELRWMPDYTAFSTLENRYEE